MLSHTVCGLYIWEFFTHLDYEWSVIRGHRPYRWTIWIYSTTRPATLLAVIIDLVALDMTAPTNCCKLWMIFQSVFGYMALSFSSLLIVLRIIAIWNKNKFVVAFAVATWLTCFIPHRRHHHADSCRMGAQFPLRHLQAIQYQE
ncbi:hypothetical protein BC827DRAFT_213687 [Russula dissimulans]|nr:hypothetical protein BC827DRAFT_213687 [Russula dissimulans]